MAESGNPIEFDSPFGTKKQNTNDNNGRTERDPRKGRDTTQMRQNTRKITATSRIFVMNIPENKVYLVSIVTNLIFPLFPFSLVL